MRLFIDNTPSKIDRIPIYLIAGIGKQKNHNPTNMVKTDATTTNHVGIELKPLITKHSGPDINTTKTITDTNKAKLIII
jgi:hypothetical protein